MTDEELKQLVASLAIAQQKTDEQMKQTDEQMKKTDEQMKKTDEQMKKTDKKLKSIGIQLGNLSKNHGDVAEEFFFRSFIKNPTLGNIKFDSVSRNLNNHIGDLQDEYDLVLINGDTLAVIEVKAKAHINDLERLVNRKMVNFPKLFSVYRNYHIYAGIATLVTNDELIEKAQELGLFLLTQQGDHAAIVQTGRLLH